MSEGAAKRPRRAIRRLRANVAVSRLTLTIVLANLIGLVILLVGSFGVTQYRDGLVQAKLEGVRAQAQLFADVLAQVAINESDCEPVAAEEASSIGATVCGLSLSQRDVNSVFNRVWDSFEGRVRIFAAPQTDEVPPVKDASALLIDDVMLRADEIVVEELAPVEEATADNALWRVARSAESFLRRFMTGGFRRSAGLRTIEAELNEALAASPFAEDRGATSVRFNEDGELVASVSVPIRRVQAIYGVVTAEIGGIEDLVSDARLAILPFFGLACAAALLTSLLLTAAIAQPIRQLAIAADKVREGIAAAGRARIPDFTSRGDEIGELSASLRSMTQAIYARIEAIESFAADVAHELKNPLTSIRSATETLDIATKPEAREKLMGVIKKDVARMDRLITDISNASRLDAELARQAREAVDLRKLLTDIVELYRVTAKPNEARVAFDPSGAPVYLFGNATALGQVFRNLIDNARSFSPPGGEVRVFLIPPPDRDRVIQVIVEDDGPGIPPDALEKVFSRFYTKRPQGSAFGNNSGLGLAISRQIVVSHDGVVWAENRADEKGDRKGARFVVELPGA
ncbi:MAG TPA: histidine kinase [Parvularcula sp.]|nr:histidine kinase [Parvularcula sp.]HBS30452.1 histidine kinase [Parvularcula sp.]HBS33741.1 histidine kinase [Parvularcula sp.]